jgi:hypothetical protein
MSDIIPPPGPAGIWRVLILDRDPTDPKWVIATIAPGDVLPASPAAPLGYDQGEITAWIRARHGLGPATALVPLVRPLAWRVDEEGQPR